MTEELETCPKCGKVKPEQYSLQIHDISHKYLAHLASFRLRLYAAGNTKDFTFTVQFPH